MLGVPPVPPTARQFCDACAQARPAAGCARLDRYTFCAGCLHAYLQTWALGDRRSPGQFVRDQRFGEGAP